MPVPICSINPSTYVDPFLIRDKRAECRITGKWRCAGAYPHRAGGPMVQLRGGGTRRGVASIVLAAALVATVAAPTRALAGAGPSATAEAAAAGTPLAA